MKRIRLFGWCLVVTAAAQLISLPLARAQGAPPPPPPAPPPMQLQQPMTAPAGMPGPIVTLRADNPRARLQQMQLRWQDICVTPCGAPVDPNGTYRVGGGSIRASDPFRMPRASGPVLIDARTGSTVKHWVGVGLAIGGAASVGVGLLYLAASNDQNADMFGTTKTATKTIGISYIVIGAILAVIGIPLAMSSTSVEVR
jgi:hypothetical protein